MLFWIIRRKKKNDIMCIFLMLKNYWYIRIVEIIFINEKYYNFYYFYYILSIFVKFMDI